LKSKSNIVILDSNFILLPFQFKIDYFNEIREIIEGELKFVIFQQIFNELEAKKRRERKATKYQRFLDAGLLFLEKNKTKYKLEIAEEIKEDNETTDIFLLRKANGLKGEDRRIFLATNDSNLRRRAKKLGLNTIFLRQKKYLSVELT